MVSSLEGHRDGQAQAESRREPLRLADLQSALREVDPAALLILPRILRRVIREDHELGGFGWRVPHRKSYTIDRQRLLEFVESDEIGIHSPEELPGTVVLLPQPTQERLDTAPAADLLVEYWRLLFHARIHVALESKFTDGKLADADVLRRIRRIGPAAFEEIHAVLKQENLLLPPQDNRAVYVEFAAVYLELRWFAPSVLPRYFPSIEDLDAIDSLLSDDVDAESLFRSTRPKDAPTPKDVPEPEEFEEWDVLAEPLEEESPEPVEADEEPSEAKFRRLVERAQKAAAAGNVVRSAMLRSRAERIAPRRLTARARTGTKDDVDRLVCRLQAALELRDEGPQPWQESLAVLVRQAPRGIWTIEARLLYDLQKVCVDYEREIHTVDLVEWVLSWGKRPVKRPLPGQRDILMSKHLRSAARRLAAVRLSDRQRQHLSGLIRAGIDRTEQRIRERFRPQIGEVLDKVGLNPRDLPEQIARKKIIEEMLDQIVERGYLTMGDFRDALSRNNLKLPDLTRPAAQPIEASPHAHPNPESEPPADNSSEPQRGWLRRLGEKVGNTRMGRGMKRCEAFASHLLRECGRRARILLRRDEMLQADRHLSVALDGVYRRGEIYLRTMQRFTSFLFGTRTGRIFTLYVAVPFGGVYVALAGIEHLLEMLSVKGVDLKTPPVVLALGMLLLGLINVAAFRDVVWTVTKRTGRALRTVLVDLPREFFALPWVQRIVKSRIAKFMFRFLVKPGLLTAFLWVIVPRTAWEWHVSTVRITILFLATNLILNSRAGRNLEEVFLDSVVRLWHRFGIRLLANLFSLVMDLFKEFLEATERILYAVDEWLRFKSGESRATFALKAGLGAVWFCVTYVIRFCINLLIEPQINPIKHFPVVTVSHKLLLPFIPHLAGILALTLEKGLALTVATVVITSIPGIFGFLVWELKENWRLYAANRRDRLGPVMIGSHGETMPRFLKRGLHSGTLPKRFAKLRRAERKARIRGNWRAVRKHLSALHHVELAIRRYVERELIELLMETRGWQLKPLHVEEVHAGPSMVRVSVGWQAGTSPLCMAFEVRSGWLLVGITQMGWAEELAPHQRQVLANAILGLYKTAGVDLAHQQIEVALPGDSLFSIFEQGLVVWPKGDFATEVHYDLIEENSILRPEIVVGDPNRSAPVLDRSRVIFREFPICWQHWVAVWEQASGAIPKATSVAPVRVFPDGQDSSLLEDRRSHPRTA